MRDVEPNDIAGLLERCPRIAAVFLNGRKAQELFERLVANSLDGRELHVEYMPSTSPANASIPRTDKLARWRRILNWL